MILKKLFVPLVVIFSASPALADVRMPLIFGDHMVLQQGASLPVWGWAAPGESVTVTFAGQTMNGLTASNGTWKVNLAPVAYSSQGQVLTITGKNTFTFQDVLVGDVWVASGQSNMEYGIRGKPQFVDDITKSDDPQLRLFFVPKTTSLTPLDDILPSPLTYSGESSATVTALNAPADPYRAKWVLCSPDALNKINGQGFSSTAYFFARDMRAHTGKPLGVIQSCWGGTRAEAWTSVSGLKMDPILDHYVQTQSKNVSGFDALEKTYAARKAAHDTALQQWYTEVGKPWDKINDAWKKAVIDARAQGQPLPTEPAPPSPPRPSDVHTPDGSSDGPGNLFNAMISPLTPLAIKGVIWYQGEFNSGYDSGREYATLFPRMITDWRAHWGQDDFPFVFVQLPNLGNPATTPSETPGKWVWVRDSQFKTLALPNTGMTITIDIGDPYQLHPPDKQDVGHRLALEARHVAYGEDIVYSGPLYQSMKVEGDKVRLVFTNCGGGLTLGVSPYNPTGKPLPTPTELKGFGIAGADQKFYWAKAVIDGNMVILSSDQVPAPVAARYDWAECPIGDLYNREGLPAAPFRTDDWDLPESMKK